jgi:hypothetical protein
LKHVVSLLALLASLAAFAMFVGGGLFLLIVESSGERGAGALLALGGTIASLATLALVFAKRDAFEGKRGAPLAVFTALVAVLPIVVLAWGAFHFAGFPAGTTMPLLDWSIFAAGVALALGALSILVLGYLRIAGGFDRRAMPQEEAWELEVQPRATAKRPSRVVHEDDDIRVTPV